MHMHRPTPDQQDAPLPPRTDGALHHPHLEQTAWRQFVQAKTPEVFYRGWLALQCEFLRDVFSAVLVLGPPESGPFVPVAAWPETHPVPPHLTAIAERALEERRGLVTPTEARSDTAAPEVRYGVAYPINVSGRRHGVVALEIASRAEAELQAALRQLQWGSAWVELLWLRETAGQSAAANHRLQAALDLTATAVSQRRFRDAATAFVTAMATDVASDRVSLGILSGGTIQVRAISHTAKVTEHMNLVRAIAAAMEEAIDQNESVVYPPQPDMRPQVIRAHAELSRQDGEGAICSVPLTAHGRIIGAVTLERSVDRPFDRSVVELCEATAALVGPVLDLERREDRWLVTKAGDAAHRLLLQLVGPRHLGLKLALAAFLAGMLFLAFATGEYRIAATAVLEPTVKRAVAAPVPGYIAEALVRAGDLVRKDQVLARLDDRELRLQRVKWRSQYEQLARQHQQALAQRNAAQVVVLAAQMDQARSEMALVDHQLALIYLRAEIDGIVVTGDLSQALRAPVERGQVLFEIAPLDAYRVILQVDEHAIIDVQVGQPAFRTRRCRSGWERSRRSRPRAKGGITFGSRRP